MARGCQQCFLLWKAWPSTPMLGVLEWPFIYRIAHIDAWVQLLQIYRVVDIMYRICSSKENRYGSACYGASRLGANDRRLLSLTNNDELTEVLLLSTYKEHQSQTRKLGLAEGQQRMGRGLFKESILVVGPRPFSCLTLHSSLQLPP